MQGRRRLCKVAYSDDADGAGNEVPVDESNVHDLVDLDSPIRVEESKGKNEIRDILNDLSSRFELLSVEKKRVKEKQPCEDEVVEFGSAGSSFSPQQDSLDNSSEGTTNNAGGGTNAIHYLEDDDDDSVQEFDHFEPQNDGSITLTGPKSTYKLPGKIGKMLYPHQREGLKWLWSLHCLGKGGILGDDMGLGKTMQVRK